MEEFDKKFVDCSTEDKKTGALMLPCDYPKDIKNFIRQAITEAVESLRVDENIEQKVGRYIGYQKCAVQVNKKINEIVSHNSEK